MQVSDFDINLPSKTKTAQQGAPPLRPESKTTITWPSITFGLIAGTGCSAQAFGPCRRHRRPLRPSIIFGPTRRQRSPSVPSLPAARPSPANSQKCLGLLGFDPRSWASEEAKPTRRATSCSCYLCPWLYGKYCTCTGPLYFWSSVLNCTIFFALKIKYLRSAAFVST